MVRLSLGRSSLGLMMAMGLCSAALAQSATTGTATITQNPNSSVVQPGLAKPPGSAPGPKAAHKPAGTQPTLPNNPTLPQIALHPTATIGSPVPIAGPGGTTKEPTGE